jgi:hypothetical protein
MCIVCGCVKTLSLPRVWAWILTEFPVPLWTKLKMKPLEGYIYSVNEIDEIENEGYRRRCLFSK